MKNDLYDIMPELRANIVINRFEQQKIALIGEEILPKLTGFGIFKF